VVPEDKDSMSWLSDIPGLTSEAQIAGDVAKVFSRKVGRQSIVHEPEVALTKTSRWTGSSSTKSTEPSTR
jgi:hypothetical protein